MPGSGTVGMTIGVLFKNVEGFPSTPGRVIFNLHPFAISVLSPETVSIA